MEAMETREVGPFTVEVHYEEDPFSPREWDNLTIIRGWHRRTVVGDGPDINMNQYDSYEDMLHSLRDEYEDVVMIAPLLWYEHSGSTCKMGSPVDLAGSGLMRGLHRGVGARDGSRC